MKKTNKESPRLGWAKSEWKTSPAIVDFLLGVMPALLVVLVLFVQVQGQELIGTFAVEFAFFLSTLLMATKRSNKLTGLLIFLVLYFLSRMYVSTQITQAPIDEFVRSEKWVLYLIALILMTGFTFRNVGLAVSGAKALIILVFLKYTYVAIAFGGAVRPTAITENNYEIAMIAGLLIVCFNFFGKQKYLYLTLFVVTVALSSSRSGAIILVAVFLYLLGREKFKSTLTRYILTIATSIPIVVLASVLITRTDTFENLDRLNFLNQFLYNVSSWDLITWVFGTPPITQLTSDTCIHLSFYSSLLSSDQSGGCYSVILHVFVLRIIFDSGIFGLLLLVFALVKVLAVSGVERGLSMMLIIIGFINGLSVSGFNNVYIAVGLAYAILMAKAAKELNQNAFALPDPEAPQIKTQIKVLGLKS
jgi:hypothetical protein